MMSQRSGDIVVFGAGGRAGRALVGEAMRRGHRVTGVVRDPRRHQDLAGSRTRLVTGDAADPACASNVADGALALVNAVTPFSTPPKSFDGFDTAYYVRLAEILADAADQAEVARVIEIGLAATLKTTNGLIYEDPDSFPAFLRPFAQARVRGIEAWQRCSTTTDWLIITPPPGLSLDAPIIGRYQLAEDTLDPTAGQRPLSYADLAVAVVDQIECPTRHREQVAVYAAPL